MKFYNFGITLALMLMLANCILSNEENEDVLGSLPKSALFSSLTEVFQLKGNDDGRQECIPKWKGCVNRHGDCCEGLECWKRRKSFEVCVPKV